MTFRLPCHTCRHFEWGWLDDDRCAAFPDGIPDAIWLGEVDHTAPFPGDGGVRHEPIDPAAINPKDVRHHAFWVRAVEPLPHERDPLGAIVLDLERATAPGTGPVPDVLRVAWGSSEDALAMLLVLLRAGRTADLARAIQLTSAQLEAEGCDFLDDQGWLAISLNLASFHTEGALTNRETAWAALSAPFGHQYLAARTQQTLLRSMRRIVPDPPAAVEWVGANDIGSLSLTESLRIAPAPTLRIEDLVLLAPWMAVTNAAGLEAELARELAEGHRLYGRTTLRAVARLSESEEVLFVDEGLAAVVRLTWAKEVAPPEPAAEIYPSLDDWVARRMQTDHHDFTGAEPRMFAFKFRSELRIEAMLEALPDKARWEWAIRESQWYGDYLWSKRGATRVRIFANDEPGRFTIQADLVDRGDQGEGWFTMTRAMVTKSFLTAVSATDVESCTPEYD